MVVPENPPASVHNASGNETANVKRNDNIGNDCLVTKTAPVQSSQNGVNKHGGAINHSCRGVRVA